MRNFIPPTPTDSFFSLKNLVLSDNIQLFVNEIITIITGGNLEYPEGIIVDTSRQMIVGFGQFKRERF